MRMMTMGAEAKQAWRDADEGLLTWCCECDNDTELRVCEGCDDEFCYDCFEDHYDFCMGIDGGDEYGY
jgi:hypothetical protein